MRVSPEIESLIPYKPGKPIEETKRQLGLKTVVKLASNENPLGPSPRAVAAIQGACADLARYPDPTCFRLREALAQQWAVTPEEILIGNGSNELIDLLIRVFCEPGDKVMFPQKSFVAYGVCAQAARVGVREIPVDQSFTWDIGSELGGWLKQNKRSEKILFLANPNNPTGTYMNQSQVHQVLELLGGREDVLVVLDEAYNEYVRATDFPDGLSLYRKYPNLLLLRTFSKIYGLAGLRVGALVGREEHLQWLHRVRNPFNVNSLAQEATLAALDDVSYLKASQEVIWQGLDRSYKWLETQGLPYVPSQTNFVLFDSLRSGEAFFQAAMKKGVLLRPMGPYGLPSHIRMSIGTPEEMDFALPILEQVLQEVPRK